MITVFSNARLLDAAHPHDDGRYSVAVEKGGIVDVQRGEMKLANATVIDLGGKTLMPGLIDCHVHVIATLANLGDNARLPGVFAVLRTVPVLKAMLMRGFTSVRDAGGADHALAQAVETGLIAGPRLFIAGKALSQTGGHGDFGSRYLSENLDACPCHRYHGSIARVVDGIDELRLAIRQEIRQGAHQIKIMSSGGVSSPIDRLEYLQYSESEILAAVEEAANHKTYVMAHAYTAEAIHRSVALGVRSIEHGNLVDDATARFMHERGAFAVPTTITYEATRNDGAAAGFPADSMEKNERVWAKGMEALEIFRRNEVKVAYGSDLLGDMHKHQSGEFGIRSRVYSPFEVICQATSNAAELLRMEGRLGIVAPGAIADLLVVNGDPLANIGVLADDGAHLSVIMKDGAFVKNEMSRG
jgi:imidazolonepropionase-like amidohydrolase